MRTLMRKMMFGVVKVVASGVCVLFGGLFLCGCDPTETEVRYVDSIEIYSRGDWHPDKLTGDRPGSVGVGFYAKACVADEAVRGGYRIQTRLHTCGYYNDSGWWIPMSPEWPEFPLSVESARAGRDGYAPFMVTATNTGCGAWVYGGIYTHVAAMVKDKGAQASAKFASTYDPDHIYSLLAPHTMYEYRAPYWYFGSYWLSGSFNVSGSYGSNGVSVASVGDAFAAADDPLPPLPDENVMYPTEAEWEFLIDGGWGIGDTFVVHRRQISQKVGFDSRPVSKIVPTNNCSRQDILEVGAPYQISYFVEVCRPLNLMGRVFTGTLKTQAMAEPVPIEFVPIACNPEMTRFIFRSSYLIPVEAEEYAPDPAEYEVFGREAILFPVQNRDTMDVEVDLKSQLLFDFCSYWLTDEPLADPTLDGIVNFEDYQFAITYPEYFDYSVPYWPY